MKRMTFLFICLLHAVFADELMPHNEPIVFSEPPKPNIMLVLDSSGSMMYFDMNRPNKYDVAYAKKNFASYHKNPSQLPTNNIRNPECYYGAYNRFSACNLPGMSNAEIKRLNIDGKYSRRATLLWTVENLIQEYGEKANIGLAPLANPNRRNVGNSSYFEEPREEVFDDVFVMPSKLKQGQSNVLKFYQSGANGGTPLNHSVYKASALMRGLTTHTKKGATTKVLKFPPAAEYRCQEQHLVLLTDG